MCCSALCPCRGAVQMRIISILVSLFACPPSLVQLACATDHPHYSVVGPSLVLTAVGDDSVTLLTGVITGNFVFLLECVGWGCPLQFGTVG